MPPPLTTPTPLALHSRSLLQRRTRPSLHRRRRLALPLALSPRQHHLPLRVPQHRLHHPLHPRNLMHRHILPPHFPLPLHHDKTPIPIRMQHHPSHITHPLSPSPPRSFQHPRNALVPTALPHRRAPLRNQHEIPVRPQRHDPRPVRPPPVLDPRLQRRQ